MTTTERVFLIGYRGSGKTTVGRLLAGRVGWAFVDADEEMERRTDRTISQLFTDEGELAFRARERAPLSDFTKLNRHVIACGGGVILAADNRHLLRSTGHCVWLTSSPSTLVTRLATDPTTAARRPPLTDLRDREPLYRATAHCVVTTDGRSPDEVVSAILSQWPTSPSNSP